MHETWFGLGEFPRGHSFCTGHYISGDDDDN